MGFCSATGSRALSKLLRRDPVDFFLDAGFVEEAAALQNRFAVRDHVGMAAPIRVSIRGIEFPRVGILSQDVVGAPDLSPKFYHHGGTETQRESYDRLLILVVFSLCHCASMVK